MYPASRKRRTVQSQTERQLAHQHGDFMTSQVYAYIQTWAPLNSMAIKRKHQHCILGTLSPPLLPPGNKASYML